MLKCEHCSAGGKDKLSYPSAFINETLAPLILNFNGSAYEA
uniref:Uncharacterized protein n=1 Tax=Anguilla anguilla TaxID=7936 RepID=A0A0E9WB31_ANGAN